MSERSWFQVTRATDLLEGGGLDQETVLSENAGDKESGGNECGEHFIAKSVGMGVFVGGRGRWR